MKKLTLFALSGLLALAAACTRPEAPAAEPAQVQPAEPARAEPARLEPAPAAPVAETATFQVPGLDAELVSKLTQALADKPGVVSARADQPAATFAVTFTPAQTNPGALLAALQTVKADCSLKGVAPAAADAAAPAKHDCGGCPHRNACAKAH